MSSLPQESGLLQTTSDQHHQSEEVIVAEITDLSLTELALPSSSSSSSSSNHNLLQHFSHDHPLILIQVVVKEEEEEEGNNNIDVQLTTTSSTVTVGGLGQEKKSVVCPGCRDDPVVVSDDGGLIYRCSSTAAGCSDKDSFFLHKSCAELPMKMVSTLHSQHFLDLVPCTLKCTCDKCGGEILGFSYSCPPCDLDLHIKCASQHKIEPSESHPHQDHSFILLKSATFTCDACGVDEETKSVPKVCTTCQFQVHTYKSCSSPSYPLTLKQIRHSHKLILTNSYQLDFDFSDKSCKICNKKMNSVLCVYYCSPCAYIAHVRCATLEYLRDEYEDQVVETTNKISLLGGEGEGEDQKATELQQQQQQQLLEHFSHPHCLILSNDEPKIDQLCDGCLCPISVPFYTCPTDQCNFSLHKQCAELLGKIRHPLHRHLLTLHERHPIRPVFKCRGCRIWCNGFSYSCDECNKFNICVGCSLFSATLSHEGHKCPLNVIYSDKTKCSTCDLNYSTKFICEECKFDLCLRCASLPKATMHKCPKPDWGIRPIKLTYYSDEYETGEYYCDICEECRDQSHWFYYCEACDYSCHPQCILGKHLIKFGKTYEFEIHHHLLTIVKNLKGRTTGANCDDSCKDSPLLVCPECDICKHVIKSCPEFWRI